MGLSRLTPEPNVYRNNEQTMFVMVYVDDLLFLGQQPEVDKTFKEVPKHVLLRPTGTLGISQTIQFLGRDIHNNGGYFEVSLKPEYITITEGNKNGSKQSSISSRDGNPETIHKR